MTTKQLMACGADFAADWAYGKDKKALREFDGQSEAMDMAHSLFVAGELTRQQADGAADWIYEGMVKKIKELERTRK